MAQSPKLPLAPATTGRAPRALLGRVAPRGLPCAARLVASPNEVLRHALAGLVAALVALVQVELGLLLAILVELFAQQLEQRLLPQ